MSARARAGVAAAGAAVFVAATAFAWSSRPTPEAAPPETTEASQSDGPLLDGATLFRSKGCATCHVGPDSRPMMDGFPDLSAATTWAGSRRDGLDAAAYLAESIREPWAFSAPGSSHVGPTEGMPGLGLAEQEIDALVTYLLDG